MKQRHRRSNTGRNCKLIYINIYIYIYSFFFLFLFLGIVLSIMVFDPLKFYSYCFHSLCSEFRYCYDVISIVHDFFIFLICHYDVISLCNGRLYAHYMCAGGGGGGGGSSHFQMILFFFFLDVTKFKHMALYMQKLLELTSEILQLKQLVLLPKC